MECEAAAGQARVFAAALARAALRRFLIRRAVFRWRTPFLAARSATEASFEIACGMTLPSPDATAARADLRAFFTRVLMDLLRAVRLPI